MTTNHDNRKRAFADVVTIDAWHEDFRDDRPKVDLHADVVFGTARVGGESNSPVRFRLSLRRAEIVVVVPESEPVSVDRTSVSRDAPDLQGHITEIVEGSAQARIKGSASTSLGATGLAGSANFDASGEASLATSKKLEISGTVSVLLVTQSQTADGHYRWSVQSRRGGILEGRPWDGSKQPRLKLVDNRKNPSKGIPPTVRVEVRCRREDLAIEDLQVKDENLWEAAKRRFGFKNKMAAAESYIRDRLAEEGLEVRNLDDIFAHVTLGSVTAGTE